MTKTILVSTLSAILTGLLVLGGVNLTDDDIYYCESKALIMECSRFSASELRCYPSLTTNKGYRDCRSGWIEVVDDIVIEPKENVSAKKKVICNGKEWIVADDEYLEPYTKIRSGEREGYLGECI